MMRKRFSFWMVVAILIGPFMVTSPCHAESMKADEIVGLKNGRISIAAREESLKDVLKQVEEKTGIRIVIHEGVPDKKVSVNVSAIPANDIASILKEMSVKNYAVSYDRDNRVRTVHIVPDGKSAPAILTSTPGVFPILPLFAGAKDVTTIQGNPISEMPATNGNVPARYVKNEVILKFRKELNAEQIAELQQQYNLTFIADDQLAAIGYIKAVISDNRDAEDVIREIDRNNGLVEIAEPNGIAGNLTVSDPFYPFQTYIPDTHFDMAWTLLKKKTPVTVAVIDSGVNAGHPDLKGKVGDGYDIIGNTRNTHDDNGHGTFVTGIIAAAANNAGIRGLYENAVVMPVKVLNADGIGTYADVAKGIIWAAYHRAPVINLSLGGALYSSMLGNAVSYALAKGCILVAAGGNDGVEQPVYPAAYPDVIGVGALDTDSAAWANSNRGKHIAVSAPGVDILSLGPDNDYAIGTGTSASTAMVSALAASLVSERPSLSSFAIGQIIMRTSRDLGEKGRDIVYGAGAIDAMKALE